MLCCIKTSYLKSISNTIKQIIISLYIIHLGYIRSRVTEKVGNLSWS